MKIFVAFSALLAVASASHLYYAPRLIVPAASSQYHSQDGIGQYSYGYNDHLSSKQEVKSFDGTTRGSYSYIDANNVLQTTDYIADAGGFRVAATNLPKAVQAPLVPALDSPKQVEDTFEVAAAKAAHFAATEEAKKRVTIPIASPVIDPSLPVADTPEVAAAKIAHFAAIEEAKIRNGVQSTVVVIPVPNGLPKPVEDTPEVAKAKAQHLIAIDEAKLRNSIVQSAPLQLAYNSLPLVARGFSYNVVNTGQSSPSKFLDNSGLTYVISNTGYTNGPYVHSLL